MQDPESSKGGHDKTQKQVEDGHKGIIFNIQRFCVNDGPGIRTLVFLKGCPLKCLWCSNPESQMLSPQVIFNEERCIDCGACIQVCPRSAIVRLTGKDKRIRRDRCDACGKCVEVCPGEGMRMVGEYKRVDQVIEEVKKDRPFYDKSGGGVTLSGGEGLKQPKFSKRILEECKKIGIHTAIETCGYIRDWEAFQEILDNTDLVLYDIKHMDSIHHRKYTGGSNAVILENAKRIARKEIAMVIRIPLIPGHNDSKQNITATVKFVKRFLPPVEQIDLLPFHQLGRKKYEGLDMKYALKELKPPSKERVAETKKTVESFGFNVTVGG